MRETGDDGQSSIQQAARIVVGKNGNISNISNVI